MEDLCAEATTGASGASRLSEWTVGPVGDSIQKSYLCAVNLADGRPVATDSITLHARALNSIASRDPYLSSRAICEASQGSDGRDSMKQVGTGSMVDAKTVGNRVHHRLT